MRNPPELGGLQRAVVKPARVGIVLERRGRGVVVHRYPLFNDTIRGIQIAGRDNRPDTVVDDTGYCNRSDAARRRCLRAAHSAPMMRDGRAVPADGDVALLDTGQTGLRHAGDTAIGIREGVGDGRGAVFGLIIDVLDETILPIPADIVAGPGR